MGPTTYEVEKIGNGFLAVMAKPVAGEWVDEEFAGIAATGIKQIVSLLEQPEAYEVGLATEQELCERHGMRFVAYPIPDRGLPHSVAEFASFTKNLYHEIAAGESAVVHCRAGIGRTGIVAAGILLHAGLEPVEAFARVSKSRGVDVPDTDEQRNWLCDAFTEIVGD